MGYGTPRRLRRSVGHAPGDVGAILSCLLSHLLAASSRREPVHPCSHRGCDRCICWGDLVCRDLRSSQLACARLIASISSNGLLTTLTLDIDPLGTCGVVRLPEHARVADDHSRSAHRKPRDHRYLEQATPVSAPQRSEVVMKRSSARRARRWVMQELTHLDQRREPSSPSSPISPAQYVWQMLSRIACYAARLVR